MPAFIITRRTIMVNDHCTGTGAGPLVLHAALENVLYDALGRAMIR